MATIRARKQAHGSTRYTAIVRIRRGTTIVYQEYKTFAVRTAASSWAKHRVVTLEQPGALTRQSWCTHARRAHSLVHRYLRKHLEVSFHTCWAS